MISVEEQVAWLARAAAIRADGQATGVRVQCPNCVGLGACPDCHRRSVDYACAHAGAAPELIEGKTLDERGITA